MTYLNLLRVELPRRLGGLEELDRLEQQIVEVERVGVLERLQVALVDLRDLLVAEVPGAAQRIRPLHPVLGLADPRERHRGGTSLSSMPSSRSACFTTATWSEES